MEVTEGNEKARQETSEGAMDGSDWDDAGSRFLACGCARYSGLVSDCTSLGVGFFTGFVVSAWKNTFTKVGMVGKGEVEKPDSSKQILNPSNPAAVGKNTANFGWDNGKKNQGKAVFRDVVLVIK